MGPLSLVRVPGWSPSRVVAALGQLFAPPLVALALLAFGVASSLALCSSLSVLWFSASRKAVHPEGPLPPGVLKRLGSGLGEKTGGLNIPHGVAKLAAGDIWLRVCRSSPGTVMVLSILDTRHEYTIIKCLILHSKSLPLLLSLSFHFSDWKLSLYILP